MTRRRRTAVAVVVALAATLGACGDDAASDPSAPRTAGNGDVFNDADVRFAIALVPHHAGAIELVTLTGGRPVEPAVAQLADQVRESHAPEVEIMVDWLTAWDQEVPETSLDHANADHGDDSHAGGEVAALAEASDEEFQQRWLEALVAHHDETIEIAEAQRDAGTHAGAVALAGSVITTTQQQLVQAQELLDRPAP